MTKQQYAPKEHSHPNIYLTLGFIIIVLLIFLGAMILYNDERIEDLLKHQDVKGDDCLELKDIVYKSCQLGCVNSVKHYINSTTFGDNLEDCLLFCGNTSIRVTKQTCKEDAGR